MKNGHLSASSNSNPVAISHRSLECPTPISLAPRETTSLDKASPMPVAAPVTTIVLSFKKSFILKQGFPYEDCT